MHTQSVCSSRADHCDDDNDDDDNIDNTDLDKLMCNLIMNLNSKLHNRFKFNVQTP